MLVPIQTSGKKPPLFFVHGMHGVMPMGPFFVRALGADQPLYVINANGLDGGQPTIDNVPEMVTAYLEQIHQARPMGPLVIASMCAGALAAIEIARELQENGRRVEPLILADPPPGPFGFDRQNLVDPQQPLVARQLYQTVRRDLLQHASHSYNDMPFDSDNADQLHTATLAGVGALVAFTRYIPSPYLGPTQVIVSAERAAAFFHPDMAWSKVLLGPRMVHVLPWHHMELFRSGRDSVARLLKLMLEEAPGLETLAQQQMESTSA